MNKPSKRRDARVQRLERAIAGVEQSIRCGAAVMRSALAADEWEDYKTAAAWCLGPAFTPREKAEFARYKQRLRRGDALYARIVKLSRVGREAMRREQLGWEAGREYAAAWETLEQLLITNPNVQMMLDRPFEESSSEPEDMARPLGSASEFAHHDDQRVRELLRCQRSVLLASLARLQQQDVRGGPIDSSADRGEIMGWDALFGFVGRDDEPDVSGNDDSWFPNTDESLLPFDEQDLL